MFYVGLIIISPLWGLASPKLFFEAWLAFLGVVACLIAATRRQAPCRRLVVQLFRNATRSLFIFALLFWGFYLLYHELSFGRSGAEILVYWLFSTLQLLFLLPRTSGKIDALLEKCQQPGPGAPEDKD